MLEIKSWKIFFSDYKHSCLLLLPCLFILNFKNFYTQSLKTNICLFLPCPCLLNTVILKEDPARGLKYCQKEISSFLVYFRQSVFKETKTFKFLMEVFSEYF